MPAQFIYRPIGVDPEKAVYRFQTHEADGSESHKHWMKDGPKWRRVPGISTIAKVIAGGDPGALMGWAAKLTAGYIGEHLSVVDGKATIDGQPVTPELLEQTYKLAKQEKDRARDEAGDIGTKVHAFCEQTWHDPQAAYEWLDEQTDERIISGCQAFLAWNEKHNCTPRVVEEYVWHKRYRIAGILDLLADVDGKLTLVDLKTCSRVRPEHLCQVALYILCWESLHLGGADKVQGAGILRLPREGGEPEWVDFTPILKETLDIARFAVTAYRWNTNVTRMIRKNSFKE